jgi:hypothetical protein
MSYARMCEKEAQYAKEVEELLKRAQETDEAEDREYGLDGHRPGLRHRRHRRGDGEMTL